MDIENLKSLKKEIIKCKQELLELEPQTLNNSNIQRVYNKILIKKAMLMEKYKKACHKPTIKEKIKMILRINPRKKLICDYFKTSKA